MVPVRACFSSETLWRTGLDVVLKSFGALHARIIQG